MKRSFFVSFILLICFPLFAWADVRVQVAEYDTFVDFPDGTPLEKIKSVIEKEFPPKEADVVPELHYWLNLERHGVNNLNAHWVVRGEEKMTPISGIILSFEKGGCNYESEVVDAFTRGFKIPIVTRQYLHDVVNEKSLNASGLSEPAINKRDIKSASHVITFKFDNEELRRKKGICLITTGFFKIINLNNSEVEYALLTRDYENCEKTDIQKGSISIVAFFAALNRHIVKSAPKVEYIGPLINSGNQIFTTEELNIKSERDSQKRKNESP